MAANNELYKTIQFIFGDAQIVFDKQKTVARQFSFAGVKRLVTKDMAGIHFTILDFDTKEPKKPVITAIITTMKVAKNILSTNVA